MVDFNERAELRLLANRAVILARMQALTVDGVVSMMESQKLLADRRENNEALKELKAARDGVVESHREWDMMDPKTRARVKKDLDELSPV
tara:strand:+ start:67 stop:336 length:270 start_codon:yes stop_codon:yes gene_type:complete